MRINKIFYDCDDCRTARATFKSYVKARAAGWAISRDSETCYCPECAPAHRLGGANGKHTKPRKWLPDGFEQLEIKI